MAKESKNDKEEKDEIEIVDDEGEALAKIVKLKRTLAECRVAKEEYLAGWQRAKADYINSERTFREREERTVARAYEKILTDLLSIIDSFDNAFASHPPDSPWVSGIRSIHDQARAILGRYDVRVIETDGAVFSPRLHEAIEVINTDDESKDGEIIAELQKGYMIGDAVLRPARVRVAHYRTNLENRFRGEM